MKRSVVEVKLNEKSCSSHLFRHASEITKETKGGYLEGRIEIGPDVKFPIYARICLLPSTPFEKSNPFILHPNLLHVNMKLNKRKRKLEEGDLPEDVDWMVLLKIDSDGTVYRVCGTASDPSKRFHHAMETSSYANSQAALQGEERLKEIYDYRLNESCKQGQINLGPLLLPRGQEALRPIAKIQNTDGVRYIELGNRGLMLNVITPLQKFSRGGATISDVLRQRYHDVFYREMSNNLLISSEEIFTKSKEDRLKLQLVRMLVEIFNCDQSLTFKSSDFSNIITNSKSKECGPLQLSDINPNTSCMKGNAKIFLLSFFKLVSDVRPAFILTDDSGNVPKDIEDLRAKIIQPEANHCKVVNQSVVIFRTPPQDFEVVREIQRRKLQLRITAYRPSDGRMSSTSFPFFYRQHNSSVDWDGADSGGEGNRDSTENARQGIRSSFKCRICELFKYSDTKSLPLAKPGVHRRKNEVLMYGEGPAEKKEDIRAVQEFEYRPKKLRVFEKALAIKSQDKSSRISTHVTLPCPQPRLAKKIINKAGWTLDRDLSTRNFIETISTQNVSGSSEDSHLNNQSNDILTVKQEDCQQVPMNLSLSKRISHPCYLEPLAGFVR